MGIELIGRVQNFGRDAAEVATALGLAPQRVEKLLESMPWNRAGSLAEDARRMASAGDYSAKGPVHVPYLKIQDDGDALAAAWSMERLPPGSPAAQIHASAKDSVLKLFAGNPIGTGFMINERFALTGNHVIADKSNHLIPGINAQLSDGSTMSVRVVARAPAEDMALLSLNGAGNQLPWLKLSSANGLKANELVYSVGSWFDTDRRIITGGTHELLRFGNAKRYTPFDDIPLHNVSFMETRVPASKGFSGSPFMNSSGTVVGMMTNAELWESGGPVGQHLRVMAELTKGELPERGWLELRSEAHQHAFPVPWVSVRQLELIART